MREFNLEQALAGHPVCTRDGRPAQLIHFTVASDYPLAGVIEGYLYQWTPDGKYISSLADNPRDLVMAPVKKAGWIARYSRPHTGGYYTTVNIYVSEEAAMDKEPNASGYHEISWEE